MAKTDLPLLLIRPLRSLATALSLSWSAKDYRGAITEDRKGGSD